MSPTKACIEYYQHHRQISSHLVDQYTHGVHVLEKETGRTFPSCPDASKVGVTDGAKDTSKGITAAGGFPLLLSVRSGAAVSMPGMTSSHHTPPTLSLHSIILHLPCLDFVTFLDSLSFFVVRNDGYCAQSRYE